ncbi:MAG: stage II sporulation protein M [Halanaerobiales bacterium]
MEKFFRIYLENRFPLLVFVCLILILGIGFGAYAIRSVNYSVQQELFNYFNNFLDDFQEMDYEKIDLLSESIKFNLLNIFIMWLLGLSVIIIPLVPILIFIKGFVLGFTTGFLISQFSLKGILIAIITVFPQNIIVIPCFILGGLTATGFSIKIINYFRNKIRLNFIDFFNYTSKMILLAVIVLSGSLIETYISPVLFKFMLRFF